LNKKRCRQINKVKPNEKFPSKITALICMTTFERYGSS